VTPPAPVIEPEIEFLGRMARGFLHVLRFAMLCAGVTAFALVIVRTMDVEPPADLIFPPGSVYEPPPWFERFAPNAVWLAAGLPLLLPHRWTLGRRWPLVLLVAAVVWTVPMLATSDHRWGWLLRIVATFCGTMTLVMWRTLAHLAPTRTEAAKSA
jgi:hypothetical protein